VSPTGPAPTIRTSVSTIATPCSLPRRLRGGARMDYPIWRRRPKEKTLRE
jgi:hypothetical protein